MSIEQIAIAITRLLSSAKKDKGELGKFYREFMDATIKWIRPIFLIDDGREKPEFTEFVNGGNEDFKKVVLSNVEYLLSTDEQAKNTFLDLLYRMQEDQDVNLNFTITGDKNVQVFRSDNNDINIS